MTYCEISLNLAWLEDCVIIDTATRAAYGNNPEVRAPTYATLAVSDAKLYVPVATRSTLYNTKLFQKSKNGLKGTINWNENISQTSQAKNSSLN